LCIIITEHPEKYCETSRPYTQPTRVAEKSDLIADSCCTTDTIYYSPASRTSAEFLPSRLYVFMYTLSWMIPVYRDISNLPAVCTDGDIIYTAGRLLTAEDKYVTSCVFSSLSIVQLTEYSTLDY